MPQLVYNARVFRDPHASGQKPIRQARHSDVVGDVSKVMSVVGQASDLVDKLGKSELSKLAAQGVVNRRRDDLIKKEGVPTLDLDSQERAGLVQEAVEGLMAPMPSTQLQDPMAQDAPHQGALSQGMDLVHPMGNMSGLPGEMNVPIPGQAPVTPPLDMLGAPKPTTTPQAAPPLPGAQAQVGAAPGLLAQGQQLQLDPATGQPLQNPVQDQHLRKPIPIQNLNQSKELARIHGGDPAKLAQILQAVPRMVGLQPVDLFGLASNQHLRRAEAEIIEAARGGEMARQRLEVARVKTMAVISKMGLDPHKMAVMQAKVFKTESAEDLDRARISMLEWQKKHPRKPRSINIYNRGARRQDKTIQTQLDRQTAKAQAEIKAAKSRAGTATAKIAGIEVSLTKLEEARISESKSTKAKLKVLQGSASALAAAIKKAGASGSQTGAADALKAAGFGNLIEGRYSNAKNLKAANIALKEKHSMLSKVTAADTKRRNEINKQIRLAEKDKAHMTSQGEAAKAAIKSLGGKLGRLRGINNKWLKAIADGKYAQVPPKIRQQILYTLADEQLITIEDTQ